jgi:protein TonB
MRAFPSAASDFVALQAVARREVVRRHATRSPAVPAALSVLAHAAALLAVLLFVPSRVELADIPAEATVAMVFAPPPTVVPPVAPDEVAVAPPVPIPLQSARPVPEAPAPVAATPPPALQPHSPPARLSAKPPSAHVPAVVPPASVAATAPAASAAVVPPRPVAGMETNRAPVYPAIALRRREQGNVLLSVNVSAHGRPLDVDVVQTSGHPTLDHAALDAVRQWDFVPATQAGQPVRAVAEVPVRFRLGD